MLGERRRDQEELFVVGSMADLIPEDYILKRVDQAVAFSWIREEVQTLYDAEKGRPSIDPEAAPRLMLACFLLGIVQDRRLICEAGVNLAIRWFCCFAIDEALPDHSSLTRIRQRWGAQRFQRCFQRIVRACADRGLISSETIHVDATLIRANVGWDSVVERHVDRVLRVNASASRTVEVTEKHILSDPDATLATNSRDQRLEPAYKSHVAVDGRCRRWWTPT